MPSRNTVEIVIQAKDEASQKVESIFSGITGQVAKVGLAIQGMKTIIDSTVGSLSDMVREAATSINVEAAFAGVVKKSGKSMEEMLAALEKGSAGMVDQTSLMKSYNTAAQLVGTTFANQLPDAMAYLGKVSAATGQDMGFMLDSLVRGVGRLSPMILDNLGIQVDVVTANEAYATSIGKAVEELTKEEQQTALMNQVMEKLATNTASMPDITDSAAASFARWDATVKNLKNGIGAALLPVFQRLMDAKIAFVQDITPMVIRAFERITSAILVGLDYWDKLKLAIRGMAAQVVNFVRFGDLQTEILTRLHNILSPLAQRFSKVSNTIASFRGYLQAGFGPLRAFQYSLHQLFPTEIANTINKNINKVREIFDNLGVTIKSVWDENLKPMLLSIGDFFMRAFESIDLDRVIEIGQVLLALLSPLGRIRLVAETLGIDLLQVFRNVVDGVTQFFNTLSSSGSVIESFVNEKFITPFKEFWAQVGPALKSFGDWFLSTGWPKIVAAVENAWIKAFEPLIGGLLNIWNVVAPGLGAILAWFISTGLPLIIEKTTEFITTIGNVVGGILDWINQNPQFVVAMGLLIGVVGGAVAITTAWGIATGIASAAVGVLTGALALLFSPVTLIIAAITGLIYLLSTGEGGIAGALSRAAVAAQQLSAIFLFGLLTAVNWVKARFDELVKTLQGVITWIDNAVKKVEDFLGLSGGLTGSTGAMVEWARQQPFAQQNQPRALGGRGLPGMGYNTEPDEVFVPDRPGRFMRDGAGGNGTSITIQFNGTGGPSSQGEADAAGAMIVNSLRNLGVPVRA